MLFIYLEVTSRVSSSVLVREEGFTHHPVYFVSHDFKRTELKYTTQENLTLALVINARNRGSISYHIPSLCSPTTLWEKSSLT